MSEIQTPVKVTKAKPEVSEVTMKDGRLVKFSGKRNLNKDYTIDTAAGTVTAVFDFRTGDSINFTTGVDDLEMLLQCAGHGIVQKGGDECSKVKALENGEPDVESMVVAVETVINRLANVQATLDERWFAEPGTGESFSGASVVIKAIMEASNKDGAFVKAFLEKKLESGKAEGLTRQKLYAAYRKPGTKIAAIIARMEQEKLAAAAPSNVDADADIAEMASAS